jgi:hypothetical protein
MTAEAIAAALHGRRCGRGWLAKCPAHDDRGPSLSICERDGKVLVHCFAGCSQREVVEALRALGLWPERESRGWTQAERHEWKHQRRCVEQHLPAAKLWRRAAVILGEDVLDGLKAALWDSSLPRPRSGEIAWWTSLLTRWQTLDGFALVEEYRLWKRLDPRLTTGLIRAARNLELAELRALLRCMNAVTEDSAA